MIVYAHQDVTIPRRGRGDLTIPMRTWVEVTESAGAKLLEKFSSLCNVSAEENPHDHSCVYLTTMMPPEAIIDRGARLSPQRRKLLRQAWHRSRNARVATREPYAPR
jgi:hypothetical protein